MRDRQVNLSHFPDIPRTLRSSVPKQGFVSKTKLNISKCAFCAAAPRGINFILQLNLLKLSPSFVKENQNIFVWNCFSTINFQQLLPFLV